MLQSSLHRCLLCDSPVVMGVTLHSFPKYEPYRSQWIRFCNQFIETLPDTSKICSQHFHPNCWEVISRKVGDFGIGIQKFLRYDAVPTIFPESCSSLKRSRTNSLMSKLMTPKISQKGKQTTKNRSQEMMRKLDPENMCKSCIVCDAKRSATIQLHKIPSKVGIKMAWLEFVEQCLPDFNSMDVTISMIHVCSNHFDDLNYVKDAGTVVPIPGGRQLVPNAVPSIHWANNETNINILPMDNDSDTKKNITCTALVPRQPDIVHNARMKLSRILNVNVAKTLSHKKKNTYSDGASIESLRSVKEKEKINFLKPIYPNSCTPYFCPNERCGEGFLDVNLLTEHEKLHFSSDSSYTCHICNANFVSYRSYDNHLTSHFGSEHRFCAQCSAAFSSKNQLLKHISQNHKISMIKVTSNSKRNKRRRGRRPGMRNHEHVGDHVVNIAGQRFEIEIDNSGLHDEETEGTLIEEFFEADNKKEGTTNPGGVESCVVGKVVAEGQEAVPEGVSDDYFMGDYVYDDMIIKNEDAEDAIESDEEYIVPYFPSSDDHCNENDDGHMEFAIIDEELKNHSSHVAHERPESTKGKSSKNQIHQHLSNCEENVDTIIDCFQVRPNVSRKKALIHQYSSENVDIPTESNQGRQETQKSQQSSFGMGSADSVRESSSMSTNKFSIMGQDLTSPVLDEINIVSQVSLGNTIVPPEKGTQKSCFSLERRREDPILPENDLPATQQELSSISIKSPKKCNPERRKKRRTDPIWPPVGASPLPPLVSSKRNRRSTGKADKVKVEEEILCGQGTSDLTAVKRKWMRLKLLDIDSVFPMLKVKGFVDLSQCSKKQNYLIKRNSVMSIFENLIEKAKLSTKQEDDEIDDSPGFEDVMKDFLKELAPQKFKKSTTCTLKISQTKLDTASRKRPGKKTPTRKTQSKVRKLICDPSESADEMSEITSSKESLICKPKKLNSRQERSGLEQESPLKNKAYSRSVFVELSDIFESSLVKPQTTLKIKKSTEGFNISDDYSFSRNLPIKLKRDSSTVIENLEPVVRQVCVTPSNEGTDESSEDLEESNQTADNKNEQPCDQQSVRNEVQFSESSNKISLDSNGIVEYLPLREAAGDLTKQRQDTTNIKEQQISQLDHGMDRNKETVGCARSLSEGQRGGITINVSSNSDPEDNSLLVNTSSLNEPQRRNLTTDRPGEISKLLVETPNEDVVEFGSLAELESKTPSSTETSPNLEPPSTFELELCKSSVKNSLVRLQIDQDASKCKPQRTPESPQGSEIGSIPSQISPHSLSFLHCSSFIETLQTIRAQTFDQASKTSYDYSQIQSLNEDKEKLHTEFPNNVQARDTGTPIVRFQNRSPSGDSENPTTVFLVNSPAEAYVPPFRKSVNDKEPDASECPTGKLENEREEIDKSYNNVSRTNKTDSRVLAEQMQSTEKSLSEIENQNQTSDDDHHNHTEDYVMAKNDINDQESQEFLQEDPGVINCIPPHLAESENSNSRDSFSTDQDKIKTNVTEFERKMLIAEDNAVSEGRIQQFPAENLGPEKNRELSKEGDVGLKTGGKIKGSKNRRRGVDFGRKKGRWSKKNTKSSYLKYKYHKESSLYLRQVGALVGNSSNGYPVITGWYSSHGDLQQIDLDKIPDNSRLTGHDDCAGGDVVQPCKSDSSDLTTHGETTSMQSKRKTANLQKIFKYACVYCGQGFHPREKFDDHKMFHNNTDINFYTEYYKKEATHQSTCKSCSQCRKSFPSMKLLNQHFISHLTCKSFTCSICYAVFPRSSMVLKHKVEDHGVVKQFICSLCSYCFEDELLLKSHLINDCKVVQFSTKGTGSSNIPNEEKIFPLIDFHV